MAKPSTQVLLMNAEAKIQRLMEAIELLRDEVANARLVSTLFCADAAVIAAHEVFRRKGEIIAEFQEAYQTWCQRIAKLVVEDSETTVRDGSYLEYSKTTIDEAVRDALADKYFLPWDTRHQIEGRENKKETGA